MHTHYQDGTVYETGARVRKWAGRIRVYEDGTAKLPNIILGLKSEMTRREAEAKLRAMIRESGDKPAPVLKPLTLGVYWKEHYIPLRSIRWSQPTRAGYDGYMRSLILPIFEHVFLKDIDHLRLANFFRTTEVALRLLGDAKDSRSRKSDSRGSSPGRFDRKESYEATENAEDRGTRATLSGKARDSKRSQVLGREPNAVWSPRLCHREDRNILCCAIR
jgi:hypothetical protein